MRICVMPLRLPGRRDWNALRHRLPQRSLDGLREQHRRGEAVLGALGHRLRHHRIERRDGWRERRLLASEAGGLLLLGGGDQVGQLAHVEGSVASERMEECRAEAIDVGARVGLSLAMMLR